MLRWPIHLKFNKGELKEMEDIWNDIYKPPPPKTKEFHLIQELLNDAEKYRRGDS